MFVCSSFFFFFFFFFQVVSKSALEDAKQLILSAFDENNDGRIDIAEVWNNDKTEIIQLMSHNGRKRTSDMFAQRSLKSACASAQSDQSLHCPHEENLHPWLSRLRQGKILISLRESAGWSESSLGGTWPNVRFRTFRLKCSSTVMSESRGESKIIDSLLFLYSLLELRN